MKIQRRFTQPGIDPLDTIDWDRRSSVIREPDGTVVFEMRDVEVPKAWSQVATDILAQKYFRKAGVPQADGSLGSETSARQVVDLLKNARQPMFDICLSDEVRRVRAEIQARKKTVVSERVRPLRRDRRAQFGERNAVSVRRA